MPLVQILPEKSFTASSYYNDSVKASNVRFVSGMRGSSASKEPWCSNTTDDYRKEYVTVDLGCPRTVHKVEGKDPNALFYSVEYSNNKKIWKALTSADNETYDEDTKVSVTSEAMFHALPHPQAPSVNRPIAPCAPRLN